MGSAGQTAWEEQVQENFSKKGWDSRSAITRMAFPGSTAAGPSVRQECEPQSS